MVCPDVVISGGRKLQGDFFIQGAKNALLPMIAGAMLVEQGETVLRDIPPIEDLYTALAICERLGAKVKYYENERVVTIDASGFSISKLPNDLTTQMRASVLFLAPALARLKNVKYESFGGCSIGARPIDYHYRGFVRLGATAVSELELDVRQPRLTGAEMYLDMPSHTGTENLMMAAALADGVSIIENAASEPEVVDFGSYLVKMGAKIKGLGTQTIIIEGVEKLHPVEYTPIKDRIETGSIMMALGAVGGELDLIGAHSEHMRITIAKLRQMGMHITSHGVALRLRASTPPLRPINITTWPYPGVPTDLQPCFGALSCFAEGKSYIRELVFENRFGYTSELEKMGAEIEIENDRRLLVIDGKGKLKSGTVKALDIRGGMATVIAAIGAEGETTITDTHHILRGYADLWDRLREIGVGVRELDAKPCQETETPAAIQAEPAG